MSAIIKLPADYQHYSFSNGLSYFPIKSKDQFVMVRRPVAFYMEKEKPGIYGIGYFASNHSINSRQVPVAERSKLYRQSFRQVPFHISSWSHSEPLVPQQYLDHFPSYQNKPATPLINEFVLYHSPKGAYQFLGFSSNFSYRPGPLLFSKRDWRYGIHKLREHHLPFRQKLERMKQHTHCQECGLKNPGIFNFFETHERLILDFDGPYQPVESKNFEVLCPGCHKMKDNILRFGDLNPGYEFYKTMFEH